MLPLKKTVEPPGTGLVCGNLVVVVVVVAVNVPVVSLPSRLESFPNDLFGLESRKQKQIQN